MEFAKEATAWHLDRCSLGKMTFLTKKKGQGNGFYGRLCVARERKASCALRHSAAPVPSTLVLGFLSFLRRREIGIYDYIINIHVTWRVPRQRSLYTSATVRLSMYPHSRHNVRSRCAFVLGRSRYHICFYTDILGGSRLCEASEAQPFSYRFVSLRSFSLPCSSVARARARRAHGALNTIKTFNGN